MSHRYLMCPPTHYDVTYSINPWMKPAEPTATEVATVQWQAIRDTLVQLGHQVDLLPPSPSMPDMVFAANGAVAAGAVAVVARFRHEQRRGESAAYVEWFRQAGFDTRQATRTNEGEGDYLHDGDRILAGSGFRTDPAAHREIAEQLGREVVPLTLVDPRFYHLDTALSVLGPGHVMYYPGAFSAESRDTLARLYPDALLADIDDALAFGLNAVSDGRHVLLSAAAEDLASELGRRGLDPIGLDVSELLKAGGGVKCCVLQIHPQTTGAARS